MESKAFLNEPHIADVKILAWNINGLKTKFETGNVERLLLEYDIFSISELKANRRASFPGYVSYRSAMVGGRGGVAVFVRRHLSFSVTRVDAAFTDQVWLQLSCLMPFMLGFCYVPPQDSPYFDIGAFGNIQQKVKWCEEMNFAPLIIGDINSRFGSSVNNLLQDGSAIPPGRFSYPTVPDDVRYPNENANSLAQICTNNGLLIVNNLKDGDKTFVSKLTFKRRQTWISELDVCLSHYNFIRYITSFKVIHDLSLPSDHAPLTISVSPPPQDYAGLLRRAERLGDHTVLHSAQRRQHTAVRRPLPLRQMDQDLLRTTMAHQPPPQHADDADVMAERIAAALYEVSQACATQERNHPAPGTEQPPRPRPSAASRARRVEVGAPPAGPRRRTRMARHRLVRALQGGPGTAADTPLGRGI